MINFTFEDIKNSERLIYNYIRGSHAYGLNTENSDVDTAGVFIEPKEWLFGLGLDFKEQIADERNDNVWYSLRKFMNMLLSSNPTILESLFIPDRCIIYEHPIITELKKHRQEFVTKDCFNSFLGYGVSQIRKARGLNKKIVNPITERLKPLDFAYTFYKQGSSKITNWLEYRNLKQNYCGLVCIPNMFNVYGVYYDWGNFFLNEKITIETLKYSLSTWITDNITDEVFDLKRKGLKTSDKLKKLQFQNMIMFIKEAYFLEEDDELFEWFNRQIPLGYTGMVNENQTSNELRLCSVSKGEKPICYMSYNKDGYSQHCRMYKEYQDWVKFRNPVRFNENKNKEFDRKNICHAARLMHMGLEIAKTGEVLVDRTNIDRDFLLNIRLGNTNYDEIISYLDNKKDEMEDAMNNSTLPEHIDINKVNNILLNIREDFYNGKY